MVDSERGKLGFHGLIQHEEWMRGDRVEKRLGANFLHAKETKEKELIHNLRKQRKDMLKYIKWKEWGYTNK